MDRQDTLRNLLIAGAVFVLVLAIGNTFLQRLPQSPSPDGPVDARSQPPGTVEPGAAAESAAEGARESTASDGVQPVGPTGGVFVAIEAEAEQTLPMGAVPANGLESDPAGRPYRMGLALSNVGASVESVTMTDHAEDLGSPERYELLRLLERDDGTRYRSLAIEKVRVDDADVILYDKKWQVEDVEPFHSGNEAGESVKFWIDIRQGDRPILRVTRFLRLPQQARILGRHDLESEIIIENLSEIERRVLVAYRGGVGVRQANPRFPDQFVDWGLWANGRVQGSRRRQADVTKDAARPLTLYKPSPTEPDVRLSWAATANTHFTCTMAPLNRDGADNARYLAEVSALDADGSFTTSDDVTLRFLTMRESLAPGKSLRYPVALYVGEKEGDAFREVPEYKSRNYYYQIAQGFGWCTFTWLVELMIWLLNGLHAVVRDFGVAIIILVLIVRALLHPITKKGQVNMVRMQQRMQELAPKIEEIKKKYANDKARMNQEMMKLKMNPAGQMLTCLPMLIQLPIWVALYISLSNNILMRHEPFLFTWIHDLTAPDALYTFASPIHVPLFGWELPSFNLLPILVAVFMYTQQKLQPKPKPSPNMTDQQRQQQEMMQKMGPIMSIMMLLFFYKMPSGLNLYIMSSSLFGTIEQHRIRQHIKEREAAGTLHQPDRKEPPVAEQAQKSRKRSFIERLQKAAEDAQKRRFESPRKAKKRR